MSLFGYTALRKGKKRFLKSVDSNSGAGIKLYSFDRGMERVKDHVEREERLKAISLEMGRLSKSNENSFVLALVNVVSVRAQYGFPREAEKDLRAWIAEHRNWMDRKGITAPIRPDDTYEVQYLKSKLESPSLFYEASEASRS